MLDIFILGSPCVYAKTLFLFKHWLQKLQPWRIWGGIDDTLQANIFVGPDRPACLIASIDFQLVAQYLIAHGIGCWLATVDRTKFANPHGNSVLPHIGCTL